MMANGMAWKQVPKEYRPWVRAAVAQGWTLAQGRHGHLTLTSPDGSYKTPVSGSSTNTSLFKAFTTRMRKHGVTTDRTSARIPSRTGEAPAAFQARGRGRASRAATHRSPQEGSN